MHIALLCSQLCKMGHSKLITEISLKSMTSNLYLPDINNCKFPVYIDSNYHYDIIQENLLLFNLLPIIRINVGMMKSDINLTRLNSFYNTISK